jgi:hypothetical protein
MVQTLVNVQKKRFMPDLRIVTSDNKPAEGVTVQVKGLKMAITTNENGEFTISKLPADFLRSGAVALSPH